MIGGKKGIDQSNISANSNSVTTDTNVVSFAATQTTQQQAQPLVQKIAQKANPNLVDLTRQNEKTTLHMPIYSFLWSADLYVCLFVQLLSPVRLWVTPPGPFSTPWPASSLRIPHSRSSMPCAHSFTHSASCIHVPPALSTSDSI